MKDNPLFFFSYSFLISSPFILVFILHSLPLPLPPLILPSFTVLFFILSSLPFLLYLHASIYVLVSYLPFPSLPPSLPPFLFPSLPPFLFPSIPHFLSRTPSGRSQLISLIPPLPSSFLHCLLPFPSLSSVNDTIFLTSLSPSSSCSPSTSLSLSLSY